MKKLLICTIIGLVCWGLFGCGTSGGTAETTTSEETPESTENTTLIEEITESISAESDVTPEPIQPEEKDYSIPEEFVDYTKFIGEDISVLNVDTTEWDNYDYAHDLWRGTLYGHNGTISVRLGWDDKTIVALYLKLDDTDKISENEIKEFNPILQDIFGTTVEEMNISYNYSGKDDFEFQLPKNLKQTSVCMISWNSDTMLAYMGKKPKSKPDVTPEEKPEVVIKKEPSIGMTADEVKNSTWGEPSDINKTTTKYGIREQWVYKYSTKNKYIYLDDGIVTAIQE